MLWESGNFTPAAKQESSARVLTAWQQGRRYQVARSYLDSLSELTDARSHEKPQKPIDVQDLPK